MKVDAKIINAVNLDPDKPTILVVDSCACGLGIIKLIMPFVGNFNLIYLADTEYNPLGLKSNDELMSIVNSWLGLSFGGKIKPEIVIIGCNTASISYENNLKFFKDTPDVKVVNLIMAFERMLTIKAGLILNKKVGLMATRYTINSGLYQKLIDKYSPKRKFEIIATRSERAVASMYFQTDGGRKEIRSEISSAVDGPIDTIVLGCTCLRYIKDQIIKATTSSVEFIDPIDFVPQLLIDLIGGRTQPPKNMSGVLFVNTGSPLWGSKSQRLSFAILGKQADFETIRIERDFDT